MTDVLAHGAICVERHLKHLMRKPDKLVEATVVPMIFVLLFGLLFGSVIDVPNGGYHEYIMAGIFAMGVMTAVQGTAVGAVEDMRNGITDRFRSLPMSSAAVLLGRTVGDTVMRAVSCLAMAAVGLAIGWRTHTGVLSVLAGFGLLLLFGFVMAWLGAWVGLATGSAETASSVPNVLLMPMMFLSNAYIPLTGLPHWLAVIAEWNPLSAVIGGCRDLWGNPQAAPNADAFPAQHPVLLSLVWMVLLFALVAPLAVRKYRTAVAR
ncbi:ABC transporter permease [Streptomyces rubellomurinus]|uniref:Transport permease protein n=2 Tax=Streptomyces TaxID=1883 RepID=A0A0F2T4L4_STRR3|nr:ABC transporter permease [Streptomyces rubellomurinus]KJS52916.1 ABC transporter [Streptomyces rubellomurinus subsp. indigoferus]KJS58159.1 ABC transporter [Streptomyces rubellomurinus]